MTELAKWFDFNQLGDERGLLCAIEAQRCIPFSIKRIYYIYDTDSGVARGFHAHHKLDQVLIAVSGNCKVKLDDGVITEHVVLDSRTRGLSMPAMLWHEMYDFSDDCVLLCLADDYYDESDYIRDYNEFQSLTIV